MACYHPLFAFRVLGQTDKRFTGFRNYDYSEEYKKIHKELEFTTIPCGNCIGCRLDYSKQWAMRCMLEAKDHEFNEFITLTYDEEHVPKAQGVTNFETGEVGEVKTLDFDDLQKFMKRLRIEFERKYGVTDIRFYACGEYGEKKERPHFHIICFNCPLPDKKLEKVSRKGSKQYSSEFLTKIWGKGLVRTSPVNFETCAYVARYVMKKTKGKEAVELFEDTGRKNENVRMSRRPGIARKYFDENKGKIYECDEIWIKNKYGAIPMKPPKYYDRLYDIDNHEEMESLKKHRKEIAVKIDKSEERRTNKDKLLRLAEQEDYKIKITQRLKRQVK